MTKRIVMARQVVNSLLPETIARSLVDVDSPRANEYASATHAGCEYSWRKGAWTATSTGDDGNPQMLSVPVARQVIGKPDTSRPHGVVFSVLVPGRLGGSEADESSWSS